LSFHEPPTSQTPHPGKQTVIPLIITRQFKQALELIRSSTASVFITGKAGTGKSTLLHYLRKNIRKNMVVLAPTGVAALNVKGETIHSFFNFKPGVTPADAKKTARKNIGNSLYQNIDVILIDEISMVRADLLDCVDSFLRTLSNSKAPFGGIQMVFIGDLYQLPPVVTSNEKEIFKSRYETPYFFSANAVSNRNFTYRFIELDRIFRQKDKQFVDFLNAVRNNSATRGHFAYINESLIDDGFEDDAGYIFLTTLNRSADEINAYKLSALNTKLFVSEADIEGEFDTACAPTAARLSLKPGAQVMFLNNHPDGLWVNGTVGMIEEIDRGEIFVRTDSDRIVPVNKHRWTLYKYTYAPETRTLSQEKTGDFFQYPLRLAWAITIHKSQGKTFKKVIIDFQNGTFAHGQAYVALSRCVSRDGIGLVRPLNNKHIKTDYRIINYLTKLQYAASEQRLPLDQKKAVLKQAIQNNTMIDIVYLKPNDHKSVRTIKPFRMEEKIYQGKTFTGLDALCVQDNTDRIFRIDRILDIIKQ